MKIMIDISEKTYNKIMDDAKNTPRNLNYYERIIADGNPIDFGNVSSRQAVLDALCDECELFHKNGEQTCLTKCESYHFLATLLSVSTENTNRCEDAISRSDAIRVASGYCHWSNIPKELAKLPSVSTEKTGRWIRWYEVIESADDKSTDHIPHCKCSECGTEYDSHSSQFIKYCNVCGAKMQEVEE